MALSPPAQALPARAVTPASAVSGLTVTNAPTTAAGGLSTYTLSFKTSTSGALSGTTGSTITIDLPTGTGLAFLIGATLDDGTNTIGYCNAATTSPPVAECYVYSGQSSKAGDTLTATLNGVTNPTVAKAYTLSLSTSSDTTVVTSPSYTITPATAVSAVVVTTTNNLAAAKNVSYMLSFKTSTTGALSGTTGSTITIDLPTGTGLATLANSTLDDGTNTIGYCNAATTSPPVVECYVYGGQSSQGGDILTVTLADLKNPSTTEAYTASVSTSSDTGRVVSPYYCLAAAGVPCISGVSPSSGPVDTPVVVTGINLTGATSVAFNGTAAGVGSDSSSAISTSVPALATPGDVTVTSPGGTATSPYIFRVTTMVTGLTVSDSSPSASAGALTTYTLSFATSYNGALGAGGTVGITLPAGTNAKTLLSSTVEDGGLTVGSCKAASVTAVTCSITTGQSVHAGDTVTVTLNGVINPTTVTTDATLTVQTSADTILVTSPAYAVTAATAVSATSVAVSDSLTSATGVTYTVKLKSTSPLSGETGSYLLLTAPTGTGLGSLGAATVEDGTTNVANCTAISAVAVKCPLAGSAVVNAGDSLVVTLTGLVNPSVTQAYAFRIVTSSDTRASSPSYCLAASGAPCIASVSPAAGAVGGAVTIKGIHLSGATSVSFNGTPATIVTNTSTTVTTRVPVGATTGDISVVTPGGTATSPKIFTIT